MNDITERLLRAAGWRPGRSQDVSEIKIILDRTGYEINDDIELFLREFNRLSIVFIRNGRSDSIWFDAIRASTMADPEWVSHYGERVKGKLTPIGYSNHEHLMLMESDTGEFYGAFDDFLCGLGSEAGEMIENLVNQDQEPLI
jgi:hypothetical protein